MEDETKCTCGSGQEAKDCCAKGETTTEETTPEETTEETPEETPEETTAE